MNTEHTYFVQNKSRWTKLPGGRDRVRIEALLNYPDWLLKLRYRWFARFWEKERGWEYEKYSAAFKGRDVLEIGSGLGYDGIKYSVSATSYTYAELNPIQLDFLKRITALYSRTNIGFEFMQDPTAHVFPKQYSGFYAHGVLHHVPFALAKQEFENIDKYLAPGAYCVFLMYPKERWVAAGRPDFSVFGDSTDGGCPWTEYYDLEKIQALVSSKYKLVDVSKWGHQSIEFVNYEFVKEA